MLPFRPYSGISPGNRSVAQSGSASALGAEGQRFESSHSDHPSLADASFGSASHPKLRQERREAGHSSHPVQLTRT